jgi:glutaredoxin
MSDSENAVAATSGDDRQADESSHLKVYIKPGCPWCIAAVNHLEDQGYDFTKIDVINNDAAFGEMLELSGQTLAPTLTYGTLLLADFGVPELEKFLDEHGICPED